MVVDRKAQILTLTETAPNVWEWVPTASAWVHIERQSKQNLFSRIGLGAVSVLLSMQPRSLTLYQAISYGGRHYFLTAIDRLAPVLMEVTAAQVGVVSCAASRFPDAPGADKRPKEGPEIFISFPAVLTEKYMEFEQLKPMAQTKHTYVLVAPKLVALKTGDLVDVAGKNGGKYSVQVCHTLDEYKNEYEIHSERDG